MASTSYNEIIERLSCLDAAEVWMLLDEVLGRIKAAPKHQLADFAPKGRGNSVREDWVTKLRDEWSDAS